MLRDESPVYTQVCTFSFCLYFFYNSLVFSTAVHENTFSKMSLQNSVVHTHVNDESIYYKGELFVCHP